MKLAGRLSKTLSAGYGLIIGGMLVLIFAQMAWWVIFFENNYRDSEKEIIFFQEEALAALNSRGETPDVTDAFYHSDGKWNLDPSIRTEAEKKHKRKLIMLMSETLFAMLIVSYGSFRVFRSVLRERRLNHERNLFISSVSHELKTPLTGIHLNLQTLAKMKLEEKEKDRLIQEGIEGVRRLEEQINNLLLGAEILKKQSEHTLQKFGGTGTSNPGTVIEKYLKTNHVLIMQNHIRLEKYLDMQMKLRIPEDLFYRVAGNLISNALQYSGENPEIKIRLYREGNEGVLLVEDRGQGIPKGELKNIFQALYRLEKNIRPVRGSGMGLYIVSEIVHSYGGTIRAESEGENRGSRFEVRLPVENRE